MNTVNLSRKEINVRRKSQQKGDYCKKEYGRFLVDDTIVTEAQQLG